MPIQILLIASLAVAVMLTWKRARERVIRIHEAVLWSAVWLIAAIVILLPNTTTTIANLLGVGRGVDLVLYASVVALFFLVFKLFITVDGLEKKLTDLVRRDALRDLDKHERS
ncbi:DUF2304 family protein [Patescibacteria group bacterium]|uniref:DUF2304 domain-containing protein n=1 Tax=candidate division WWE3 bacterium TaxID=2053526 RepID=A0A928Y6F7_UNCKA|nr:DUF2304 domain-containing protein [candidate division WWE3 bacterium]MCL4732628.1 DUF2304 family protein [Patescibacteria group bacterium]MDL1952718.1 DUF2304 domain-containing protein [Candidatus Uhrbacteria bacterium UHB]RIL01153.1 MAG: hypothetical protein DCC77_01260 [Candidatus Uhrbacteria bacterium]